jgi:S-adenosylmethionine:tRNA ribosyltransferase-isomerase
MRIEDLDYDLPPELIAQHPAARRDEARLLVVDHGTGALGDRRFSDLPELLREGDALVLNETRVIPARLDLHRGAGGKVEILLVRPEAEGRWRVLARPAKKAPVGERLVTADGGLTLEVVGLGEGGERMVRVVTGTLKDALAAHGRIPLPPYIHRPAEPADRERYQTVFARVDGAVAAPTAALHFTPELLDQIAARGVTIVKLVLHVGPGTFRPIAAADPRAHAMDEEWFEVGEDTARALIDARERGGRIVAVGTTAVRALESACDANGGRLGPARGWTTKFILPPYEFRAVDALVTNFHLPRTTLLLLVGAFAGENLLRRAYAHAVAEKYRFYSYGDAMFVTGKGAQV